METIKRCDIFWLVTKDYVFRVDPENGTHVVIVTCVISLGYDGMV